MKSYKVTMGFDAARVDGLLVMARRASRYWARFGHSRGAMVVIDDTDVTHRVTSSAIRRGLVVMAYKQGGHFGAWLAGREDDVTADVFLQCCLFGEVRYG